MWADLKFPPINLWVLPDALWFYEKSTGREDYDEGFHSEMGEVPGKSSDSQILVLRVRDNGREQRRR